MVPLPDFSKEFVALVDFGANINCVKKGLISTIYFEKTFQGAVNTNTKPLQIDYKVSNVHIYNKYICFNTTLLLLKDINKEIILGTPFLALLYPFRVDEGLKRVYYM